MTTSIGTLGRVLLSLLFIWAGFGKIMMPAGTIGYIAHYGLPLPPAAYVVAVIIEFVGGILLLIGFMARPVSAIMAIFTVVTALVFHTHFADVNMQIHFMKNLCIAGGLLQVTAYGAGAWSVDARMGGTAGRMGVTA
jgi:putative oxidoreductase